MLYINDRIQIPETEFDWSFVRSGGPGGQNVNKVASKAVLRWDLGASPSVPVEVKDRLRTLFGSRVTTEGELVLTSQRYRDQERNKADCLEKLGELVRAATIVPKARKKSKPTKGSRERRLAAKKHHSDIKAGRRGEVD
jgi:ribosome-associated protein